VRVHILKQHIAPTGEKPFLTAIQQYRDNFSQNYAIRAQLCIGEGVEVSDLTPEAQLQVFYIVQEALSNARKHGSADCVHLSFEQMDNRLRVCIQDNGRGFDTSALGQEKYHFGIRFMCERAEQLGGA